MKSPIQFLPHRQIVVTLTLLALLALPAAAPAQTGIYALFTGARTSIPGANTLFGPTIGLFSEPKHLGLVNLGLDVRGIFLSGSGASMDSLVLGPRLSLHTHLLPFAPYAEVAGGFGHDNSGGNTPTIVTKLEYQFIAGADHRILPRVQWRVIEFSYGSLSGFSGSFNPKTLSTGLIFNLP